MSFSYHLTDPARLDIDGILERSETQFGRAAMRRYEALIAAAIDDVVEDPYRIGSRPHPKIWVGARSWHIRLSRKRIRREGITVRYPRHMLFYRLEMGSAVIGHVLHEKMDWRRHFLGWT